MSDKVAIIPVIWEHGSPHMVLPDVISRIQWRDDRLPKNYGVDGLAQLGRFKSQREKYIKTLDILAEVIGAAHAAHMEAALPELPGPIKFNDLPQSFHNPKPGPYNLTLTVLHQKGTQWKPVFAGQTIWSQFDSMATGMKLPWEEIGADAHFRQRMLEAQSERQASILVVSFEDTSKAPWQQYLSAVDTTDLENCAVLVGFKPAAGGANAIDYAGEVRALLPVSSENGAVHDWFLLDSAKSFGEALTRAATRLRQELINADPPLKVQDASLQAAAKNEGVPVDGLSAVTGPGGAGVTR